MNGRVVIVHWNRPATCLTAVRSFVEQSHRLPVTVWDNASAAQARQELSAELSAWPGVTVHQSERNLGFAGGAAAGLALAFEEPATELCVVAAHDALAHPEAVARIHTAMATGSSIGLVFARGLEPSEGFWHPLRGMTSRRLAGSEWKGVRHGLYFPSSCWAISRSAYARGVTVDPRLFMYGEECDLGLTAQRLGIGALLQGEAEVTNAEIGGTTSRELVAYLSARNAVFLAREFGPPGAAAARGLAALAVAVGRMLGSSVPDRGVLRWQVRGNLAGLASRFGAPPESLLGRAPDSVGDRVRRTAD